jgi:nitrite reductase/ring-hydroxylating ferredoxin subunit
VSEIERTRVAVYRRSVRASLVQVWENVNDWEHLPWLHARSFRRIEPRGSGPWGWRATIEPSAANGTASEIELVRERDAERYVVRTLSGPGVGSEIWTTLTPHGDERTDVEVEFLVPGVADEHVAAVGAAYTRLYTELWDEDEAMIRHRAARRSALRVRPSAATVALDLGPVDELRARVPLIVAFGARRYRIVADRGELLVHDCDCPHRLGPLDDVSVADGRIRCPWHGYEFELRGGARVDGPGPRLFAAPELVVDPGTRRAHLVPKVI